MKRLRFISRSALTAFLLLSAVSFSFGGQGPVTPYGGYCKDCAVYGACRESIPLREALQALRKFYDERGYRLGQIVYRGRFIEAEVLQDSRHIDKVIFDRKTGRIRSMY